jgi:hypothetical protein
MKKGLLISVVGAFVALIGATVLPFFELEQLLMNVTGLEWLLGLEGPTGSIAMLIATLVLSLGVSAVIFVRKMRRAYGAANIVFGLWTMATLGYIFLACPQIFQTDVIIALVGYYFVMLGSVALLVGGLATVNAETGWLPHGPFLRVAQFFHGEVVHELMFTEPQDVTAGEGIANTFTVPSTDLPKSFKLFTATGAGEYKIGLSTAMKGQVSIGGKKSEIAEFLKANTFNVSGVNYVPFNDGDWGVWNIGRVNLFFRFVRQHRRFGSLGMVFDRDLMGVFLASVVLQFGLLAFSLFSWVESPAKPKIDDPNKTLKVEFETFEEQKQQDLGEEEDTTGKQAEGDEGKFGDTDVDPDLESKVPKRDGKMVKEIDPKKIGLNSMLSDNLNNNSALSNLMSNDEGFNNKLAVAMSGTGAEFVLGHGSGGLGFRGTGKGGGGAGGYGRIQGLGKIDTGGGVGMKASLGRKGTKKVSQINFGQGSAEGFCEKSNIRNMVMRRKNAIKACYESQLILNPDLAGKIDVRWTIDQEGKAQNATVIATTLKNGQVEDCVLRSIRRMTFQKPKGGICIVKWPFVFNPAG